MAEVEDVSLGGDALVRSFRMDLGLRLQGAITDAYVAVMSTEELVSEFDETCLRDYPLRTRFIRRLQELCAADAESGRRAVRSLIAKVVNLRQGLPRRSKRSGDSMLAELAMLLDSDSRDKLLRDLALDDRWESRAAAYKRIKLLDRTDWLGLLEDAYRRFSDEEALVMLMRSGVDPAELNLDVLQVLQDLSDDYRRSLVLEQVARRDVLAAVEEGRAFPQAMSWAIGRGRLVSQKSFVVDFLEQRLRAGELASDIREFVTETRDIGLLLWALGRLGAREELLAIAERYGVTPLGSPSAEAANDQHINSKTSPSELA